MFKHHPFYRCPDKDRPRQLICTKCKCEGHLSRACPNDIFCNCCSEPGHKQNDCGIDNGRLAFGDYAHDIAEGREADLDKSTGSTSHLAHVVEPLIPFENFRMNVDSNSIK